MSKIVRLLLLGAVAVGIVLALTSAPSSGGTRGQATGYGDDVVQPCAVGQDTGPNGEACLKSFEVASPASQTGDSGGGGTNTGLILGIGAAIIVIGGGGALAFSRLRP
jgi:hypothetical protein